MKFFKRFMYWYPWGVSNPFMPSVSRGTDEHHNKSIIVVVPLLGAFIFFWERSFQRSGPEHIWAIGPDGEEGLFVIDCDICREIRSNYSSIQLRKATK